jgi:hypothetical protein
VTAVVTNGGTSGNYHVGDILTCTETPTPSQWTVATLSGSQVATVTLHAGGSITGLFPTQPMATTSGNQGGGTGVGCTLTVAYGVNATITVTTPGTGYTSPTLVFMGTWTTSPVVSGLSLAAPLVPGTHNVAYNQTISPIYGIAPYTFALAGGSTLPTGLTLSTAGVLSGTPTVAGGYSFTAKATDSIGAVANELCYLVVA